jgi:hypothetical protein
LLSDVHRDTSLESGFDSEHTCKVCGLATWGTISLARLCVRKVYGTRAVVAVVAIIAQRKINNLRGFNRGRESESHPLRHS